MRLVAINCLSKGVQQVTLLETKDDNASSYCAPPSVTIVLLTYNGASTLPEVLSAIHSQRTAHQVSILAIDSGSTDGTSEILRSRGAEVHTISRRQFGHGRTRQLACKLARSPFLVYLVQDAIPRDQLWLNQLLRNFEDAYVAAVCSRVLPPPDANPLKRREVENDLQGSERRVEAHISNWMEYERMSPDQRRVFCSFHDISAAYRRAVLLKHPFPDVPFGEDFLIARALLEAGYKVVFEPLSVVYHTHPYRILPTYRRNRLDGWFNIAHLGRRTVPSVTRALWNTCHLVREDWTYMQKEGLPFRKRLIWILYSPIIHMAEQLGQYLGGRR